MNCLFCPDKQTVDEALVGYGTSRTEKCLTCRTCYNLNSEDVMYRYFFFATYKDKSYQSIFRTDDNTFEILAAPYKGGIKVLQIIKLDYLPNITPHNVQDKLPTLLTFL